jgi:hypothetical protein
MAWLLFMDESGHDHKNTPMEVRGGVAIHVSKLWDFVRDWQRIERDAFGYQHAEFKKEIKGAKFLEKDRFVWAGQSDRLSDDERRKLCRSFMHKGVDKKSPASQEFAAYGQASLEFARSAFEILVSAGAKLFAAAIPRGVKPPADFRQADYLRKDHVFLFERFFYFLEEKHEHGLLVMDESENSADRQFVKQMHDYFTKSHTGRQRSYWIVPSPLFVSSDMSHAVQAADLCMYCINWGFRLPSWTGIEPVREEMQSEFSAWISRLQWRGQGYRDGQVYDSYGVILVPDPYTSRANPK